MYFGKRIVDFSLDNPRLIVAIVVAATLVCSAFIPYATVDTDPENMLSRDETVRVFHNKMKNEFALHDMVVLGIVNEKHPDGVFNPQSLKHVHELTKFAETLDGVIRCDLLAPGTVDDIENIGPGTVTFRWLMDSPPKDRAACLRVRDRARENPMLYGTLVSEDGKALALYLPLTSKDKSYRVAEALRSKIAEFRGDEQYHITGLPVAEDTFGIEMFIQMAISAPMAMIIIFLLMLWFFRRLVLVVSPMLVALVSVACTMGLLVASGNTIHIMSSMIPIFIMPIAVLDSIHILSEFFDRYPQQKNRRKTIDVVMKELFTPMLYTSLTSAAGFGSLALTPIPPVQVFGIFVAFGIMLAWVLTVTLLPAYTTFISESSLEGFGHKATEDGKAPSDRLTVFLEKLGAFSANRAWSIVGMTLVISLVAVYGMGFIRVNDNPVRWFEASHPIRIADKVLNEHFGGTYMAYIALDKAPGADDTMKADQVVPAIERDARQVAGDYTDDDDEATNGIVDEFLKKVKASAAAGDTAAQLDVELSAWLADQKKQHAAQDDPMKDLLDDLSGVLKAATVKTPLFKRPEMLEWLAALQAELSKTGIVGKSTSVTDIVKKVHRELLGGDRKYSTVPKTTAGVAQCLITFQNSHDPDDLWHLVSPSYDRASMWVQLTSGDNKDMESVTKTVDAFVKNTPPPTKLRHRWYGLNYINVKWQNKMVSGMARAFLGSFAIVFLMMVVLFRSVLWGILSMVPLTVTIAFIYGLVGLIGKDYDMPVAVLSSLALGLAVDFAIHFLSRARVAVAHHGDWKSAAGPMFDEPARAITRNIIVIAVGFLPLLAAPLVPYQTVGVLLATILSVSGAATLLILPAIIGMLEPWLFPGGSAAKARQSSAATAAVILLVGASCLPATDKPAVVKHDTVKVDTVKTDTIKTTPGDEQEKGTLSVEEIVYKANLAAYYAGRDGKSDVNMVITDARGRTRKRNFTILRRNVKEGGDQRFYVYFHKPSDVRRMVFMVHKHVKGDDDRWLYLPALDLVKRIAAADKRTSFVGSHFLYEDVSGRSITADTHTLVETTAKDYVLDNVPKRPRLVEFSKYRIWIDRKTFIPHKAVYYNKEGKEYRSVEALEIKNIKGIPTVVRSRVTDLNTGAKTESTFSRIKYGIGIPDKIFTERYLRRAPRRWLRK